jgi:hypothetical protein
MIVVAAFFEALRDRTRSAKFARPQIADRDKEAAAVGRLRRRGESLFDFLCSAELPAPSPSRGFEENCLLLAASMKRISADLQAILEDARHADPTAVSGLIAVDWPTVEKRAVERYRSRYIELAAAVPEFLIWAMLGEHAATRASVAGLRADVVRGRAGQFTASFDSVLADAGIEAVKIPPRCPRANAHAERLVLAVRTEVTDRVLIVGQRHLRAVLADYETHYNGRRPHRSRQLRPPRPHHPVADLSEERIQRRPVLGGLISEYERAA